MANKYPLTHFILLLRKCQFDVAGPGEKWSKANSSSSRGTQRLRRYTTQGNPQLQSGRRAAVRGSPAAMEGNKKDQSLVGDGSSTQAHNAGPGAWRTGQRFWVYPPNGQLCSFAKGDPPSPRSPFLLPRHSSAFRISSPSD